MSILEDLHWAGESSLALLIHLANRVAQLPVVIIGTYRDGYSENNPAFVRTLEELIRKGIRPLKVGGLSKDAVAQMINGLSRLHAPKTLVSLIFEESQGNPFFVEEVYRHLSEEAKLFDDAGQFRTDIKIAESDVPENVRLVIGRRPRTCRSRQRSEPSALACSRYRSESTSAHRSENTSIEKFLFFSERGEAEGTSRGNMRLWPDSNVRSDDRNGNSLKKAATYDSE